MIGSVLNEGVRGLQQSSREIQRSAQEISRANIGPSGQENARTEQTTQPEEQSTLSPLQEGPETSAQRDISEPLIELRRQEQLFNASAEVVSVADQTLGSIIDVTT